MNDLASLAYVCPPAQSFWTWDEEGQVASWVNGRTIAFRPELDRILESLSSTGFPHFDAVLLLVAACRDGWRQNSEEAGLLIGLARTLAAHPSPRGADVADLLSLDTARKLAASDLLAPEGGREELQVEDSRDALERLTVLALETLDRVHELFARSRKGLDRMELLVRHVLEVAPSRHPPEAAANILAVFRQGFSGEGLTETVDRARLRPPSRERLIETLDSLVLSLDRERLEGQELERIARTGLEVTPVAPDVEIPPSRRARKLLGELLEDESLRGLGELARELAAVVHIPRRIEESDELPSGGFSDLTNRGPLDRLVVSELAHDSTTLAVRVAMNEALYLRREVPPRGPQGVRALLVDTGIRLWGTPRVFAAATALAAAATADPREEVCAFEARGGGIREIDLLSREGLTGHLETLETTVHAGEAMRAFAEECRKREIGDAVLITQDDVFEDPEFRRVLQEVWSGDLYVVTVNQGGEYRLWRHSGRGVQDLQEAHLDLEKILGASDGTAARDSLLESRRNTELPLVYSLRPLPLRIPCHLRPRHSAYHRLFGLVSVTKDRRLLYWDSEDLGPIELTDHLPAGGVLLVEMDGEGSVVVLFRKRPPDGLRLLRAHLRERRSEVVDLHPTDHETRGAFLQNGGLIWIGESSTEVFSLIDGRRIDEVLTLPRSWRNRGRIFSHAPRYRLLNFDGQQLTLDEVSCFRLSDRHLVSTCFERDGFDGVWDVTLDGRVRSTATGTESICPYPVAGRVIGVDVSPDGHRLVLRDTAAGGPVKTIGWNLQARTAEPCPDPSRFLHPWIARYSRPEAENIVRQVGKLRGALVTRDRSLMIVTSSGKLVGLRLVTPRKTTSIGFYTHQAQAWLEQQAEPVIKRFEPCGSEGERLRVKVAAWGDGSRLFVDSRGLVHLMSSDQEIPEISLVLRGDSETAGWASSGEFYGPSYYHGARRTVDAERFYRHIERFLMRLPTEELAR